MGSARKTEILAEAWVPLIQAARELGESRLKVLSRAVKGDLEAQHIAGTTVISRESLERVKATKNTPEK